VLKEVKMKYGRRLNAGHYLNMRKADITIANRKASYLREIGGYVSAVCYGDTMIPIVYESGL